MIKKFVAAVLSCVVLIVLNNMATAETTAKAEDVKHRIGIGARYWFALESIDAHGIDESGLCYFATYQYQPAYFFKIEGTVEVLPDNYGGSSNTVFAPQAYLIVGKGLYAGVGIGGYYSDGDFSNDPFYALCAGLDVEVLPFLFLDLRINYRFDQWGDFEFDDIDTDTITVGAAALFQI